MPRCGKSPLILLLALLLTTACVPSESLPPEAQATSVTLRQTEAAQNALALELQALAAEREATRKAQEMFAAQATADAFRAAQTAAAFEVTRAAQATATERAWITRQTQSALEVQQTAQAWQMTQTAAQSEATATQVALLRQATVDAANAAALATAQAAQAGIAQEALRQEQIRTLRQDYAKYAWAALPFVLIGLLAVLGLMGMWLWKRNQVLTQLADGKLILLQNGKVIIPDRAPGAVVDPNHPPQLTDGTLRVVENDQKVSAIRALAGSGRAETARRLAQSIGAAQPQVAVRVLQENEARPLLGEVVNGIYREAIEHDQQT